MGRMVVMTGLVRIAFWVIVAFVAINVVIFLVFGVGCSSGSGGEVG
jgi:hypothetical protein